METEAVLISLVDVMSKPKSRIPKKKKPPTEGETAHVQSPEVKTEDSDDDFKPTSEAVHTFFNNAI